MEVVDVVVVGAGAAGLACARELSRHGASVVVLEARDRVGGRILTARPAGEDPVELGAQVIHGAGAPTRAVAREAGLRARPAPWPDELAFAIDGRLRGAPELARDGWLAPWTLDGEIARLKLGDRPVDEALATLCVEGVPRRVALEWLGQTWCADTRDLSVAGIARVRSTWRSGEGELTVVEGYDRVAAHLAAGLDVRLEAPVDSVSWRPGSVEVRAGGETWRASAAVVTLPPRVLAAGAIRIDPPLGDAKLRAARAIGVGDALVVLATLDEPAARSALGVVVGERGSFWRVTAGSRAVLGWAKGPAAGRVRQSGADAELVASAIGTLFPWLAAGLAASGLLVADWGADPYALGGYSYPRVGCLDAPAELAAPVAATLFFAGEATCSDGHAALVQGALDSGLRAASEAHAALAGAAARGGHPAPAGGTPVTYNPLLRSVREDPYPTYERLRADDPVHFNPDAGMWFLVRHADCSAALRDPRLSAQLAHDERSPLRDVAHSMLTVDDPDHGRLRVPVARAFSARAVAAWRPRVQTHAGELISALDLRAGFDVIGDLARPLTIGALGDLLAIAATDVDRFHAHVRAASSVLDPLGPEEAQVAGEQAIEALEQFLAAVAGRRRRARGDDVVGTLVAAVDDEGSISWPELLMTLELIAVGGYEPTVHLIGNGVLALLHDPTQAARLRDDPALVATAVDELLRFDSPIQFASRVAREDLEVGGRQIAAGERVLCLLGAANRDPDEFADPARLDVGRRPNHHLGFGGGVHFCLGSALARIIAGSAIEALGDALTALELRDEPGWCDSVIPRGLVGLNVRARQPVSRR